MMKKILAVLLLGFWMMQIAWAEPETILRDTQGRAVQLSKLKGKWIVLNYWASWCDKCREEIPELNRLAANQRGRDIVLIGVNADYLTLPELQQQVKTMGIQYPVLTEDPEIAWKLPHATVLPTTYILDPNGKVVKTIYGENTENSLVSAIDSLRK